MYRRAAFRFAIVGVAALVSSLVGAGAGMSDVASTAPYSMTLRALTGPKGADVRLQVVASGGAAAVEELKKVQVKVFGTDGKLDDVRNLADVPARGGIAHIDLGLVERDRRVETDLLVQTGTPASTHVIRGTARTQLRPDLVVRSLQAPRQTLTSRPIDVQTEIAEVNGDTGATAKVTLLWGPSLLATAEVTVPADGIVPLSFTGIHLATSSPVELTVVVSDVDPGETDETNNLRRATVDVTEHELVPSWLVLPSLGGYGAQFNQHVYAAVTPKPAGSLPGLEEKVNALEPQLVRVFYHEVQERTADQMASFIETVELAQQSGATINITYQTATNAKLQPEKFMGEFAAVLDNLVRTRGSTNVRWVTIQNEPNTTLVTQAQYNALYRALDAQLQELGLRDEIGLMGGDLVESSSVAGSNHVFWFQYMAQNMNDILDAYSVHIYWNYWDIARMEYRLKSVRQIVADLPVEAQKPVYVTEFGVRGIQNVAGLPAIQPGYWQDGTPLSRTNIAAFQQLQFNTLATQLGYSGTVKWDAYWGRYSPGYREVYNLIGPAEEGWPLYPSYHALLLQLQTTERGWQVLGVAPWADDDWKLSDSGAANDQAEKELTAYSGPDGQLTLVGLDTHGRALNTSSTEMPSYSIGGLPPGVVFSLAVWNATGTGENSIVATVTTNGAGVARFEVPLHAGFALTTVPVS